LNVACSRAAGSDLSDHQTLADGFDNIVGDDRQAVDFHDAFNLNKQAVQKPKVASGDAGD
jgi:hypothetical protein